MYDKMRYKKREYATDVLIIGGGIAGCFAAIKAKERGAKVLLADKGYVSSSGQTPFAGSLLVFDGKRHDKAAWLNEIKRRSDFVANLQWAEMTLDYSREIFDDLVSYGAEFFKNPDGTYFEAGMEGALCRSVLPDERQLTPSLRKKVLHSGVTILDRVMIVELIVTDGIVTGAVGFSVDEAEPHIITAKAVVISTGAAGFRPPGWPISNLTADGDMMAYKAGAEITGKEFTDLHFTSNVNPSSMGRNPLERDFSDPSHGGPMNFALPQNSEGREIDPRGLNLAIEFEVHAGRGPIYRGEAGKTPQMISCAAFGMSSHKAEGIWPAGTDGGVGVPGLYAAGDSLGTMMSGGAYASIGFALMGSAVTGRLAGEAAADFAKTAAQKEGTDTEALLKKIYAPLNRQGGFSPAWTTRLLQNIMMPYFVSLIKSEDRLKTALAQVEYLRDHIVPKLRAADAHELRLAIETANMIGNAEMKLRASLARRESRGTHYREDYPQRNENGSVQWYTLYNDSGVMNTRSYPVPQAWQKRDDENYFIRFPENLR